MQKNTQDKVIITLENELLFVLVKPPVKQAGRSWMDQGQNVQTHLQFGGQIYLQALEQAARVLEVLITSTIHWKTRTRIILIIWMPKYKYNCLIPVLPLDQLLPPFSCSVQVSPTAFLNSTLIACNQSLRCAGTKISHFGFVEPNSALTQEYSKLREIQLHKTSRGSKSGLLPSNITETGHLASMACRFAHHTIISLS